MPSTVATAPAASPRRSVGTPSSSPDGAIAPDGSITIAFQASGSRTTLVRRIQCRWCRIGDVHERRLSTRRFPAGCVGFDGYAVRGVVRPAATERSTSGSASCICAGDTEQSRVVLTSQTVGTEHLQLVGDAAARRDRRRSTTRSRSTSSAPTSCSTPHAGGATHVHRYTTAGRSGRRLGCGWRRHPGGRVRRRRRVHGARRRPGRCRQRQLVRVAVRRRCTSTDCCRTVPSTRRSRGCRLRWAAS